MPRLYSIDVQICGTAYIKANSMKEARAKLKEIEGCGLEVADGSESGLVSGRRYNDPLLPNISLSPAMTIHGKFARATVELVEDNVPEFKKGNE